MIVRRRVSGCLFLCVAALLVATTETGDVAIRLTAFIAAWLSAFLGAALLAADIAFPRGRVTTAAAVEQSDVAIDELVGRLSEALELARTSIPALRFECVNLTGLVADAVARRDVERVRFGLKPSLEPPSLHALGDGAHVARVVDILIENALSSGSRATVHLDHGTSMLALHVDDNGAGIARRDREFVFETSYDAEADPLPRTRDRAELVRARKIARAHNGDITISASPDGGARFTLRLPLFEPHQIELAKAS
jgi:signal transduction histidine kinase